jgi:hypothetical protein
MEYDRINQAWETRFRLRRNRTTTPNPGVSRGEINHTAIVNAFTFFPPPYFFEFDRNHKSVNIQSFAVVVIIDRLLNIPYRETYDAIDSVFQYSSSAAKGIQLEFGLYGT